MLRNIEGSATLVVWLGALFVYGLVGLGILNTMLMSVLERTREFGVLRAIGTRPGRVVAQVLGESFWIATLSGAAGLGGRPGCSPGTARSTRCMNIARRGEALEYAGTVLRSGVTTRFSPGDALSGRGSST